MADYIMAIGAIILASLCFLSIVGGFKGAMKKAGQQERKALGLVNKYGYQAINGIKEITVLGRRENFVEQYNSAALIRQKSTLTNSFLSACPDRILEGVCLGGFIGIVCIRIISGAELDNFIPLLGTFAMAAFKILPSISKVSTRINSLVFYRPYLQGVYDNMMSSRKYEEEMKEYKKTHTNQSMVDIDEDQLLGFKYSLKINNISWKYQNTEYNVLEHTNLSINKGESVALIGSSGAGKSTLADIIMGLFRPQKGTVEMDGIDIYTIPQQWTKIIGYVPQSVFLIDDTIRRNVAFGLEDKDIDEGKIWHALEQAQLKDFVSGLPNGLDTIVGERGVKFSGGQRQRVAIARALYENPDILVLDEATSALDNETEQAVMESIDALQGSKTLIIVAHRLTTIRNCDKIYEVKDGKIELCEKEEVLGVN
jgi:ABC-type multidrug transport system fused ATPase/permease subunit